MLSALTQDSFHNHYDYNQFASSHYSIQTIVGSAATILFPVGELKGDLNRLPDETLTLVFMDMEGHTFSTVLRRMCNKSAYLSERVSGSFNLNY